MPRRSSYSDDEEEDRKPQILPSVTRTPLSPPEKGAGTASHSSDEDEDRNPQILPAVNRPPLSPPEAGAGASSSSSSSDAPPLPSQAWPEAAPLLAKPLRCHHPPMRTAASERRKRKAVVGDEYASDNPLTPPARKPFVRVWSEKDEISLLEGLVRYWKEYGGAPSIYREFERFEAMIVGNFHGVFSKRQVSDKISKMKRKFLSSSTGKRSGERQFLDAHEREVYNLSMKLWGGEQGASNGMNIPEKNPLEGERGPAYQEDGIADLPLKDIQNVATSPPNKSSEEELIDAQVDSPPEAAQNNAGLHNGTKSKKAATGPSPVLEETLMGRPEDGGLRKSALYPLTIEAMANMEKTDEKAPLCYSLKRALEVISPAKGKELEEKWKQYRLAEMRLYRSRLQLEGEMLCVLEEALENGNP